MLLQTNSYIVPKEKRAEHARLMRRFRQALHQVGCDNFEVYEQVGANWSGAAASGRFVQIMRFRDRQHQLAVQNAERNDPIAQKLIAEFCELINYPQQQQQQQFVVGFYASAFPVAPLRAPVAGETPAEVEEGDAAGETAASAAPNASSAQPADALDAEGDPQETKLEQTFEETAAAMSAEEMPVEETTGEEGKAASAQENALEEATGEAEIIEAPAGEPAEAFFQETTISEEMLEETAPAAIEASEEDIFGEEAEATGDEKAEATADDVEAAEDKPASEALHPEIASESGELNLESDLLGGEEVDDISRLAEELAADEEVLDPRHPDPTLHQRGRASGNGAH